MYEERLYEASLGELIALLNETPDDVADLLLIGHNPGMHALADALAGEAEGDALARMNRSGFPTSAFAVLAFTAPGRPSSTASARLVDFWAPHA